MLNKLFIKVANKPWQLQEIEKLAIEIWHQHYSQIIGKQQVEYMLQKFQTVEAMQIQIDEGYEYYSIYQEDQLIGYLSFRQRNDRIFLSKVYIHVHERGKGYGRKIFDFVLEKAKEHCLSKVELTVNKYNTKSIAIYEKYGFKKLKEAVFDIGQGYVMDDFVMEYSF